MAAERVDKKNNGKSVHENLDRGERIMRRILDREERFRRAAIASENSDLDVLDYYERNESRRLGLR